jgi:hypothetical protein
VPRLFQDQWCQVSVTAVSCHASKEDCGTTAAETQLFGSHLPAFPTFEQLELTQIIAAWHSRANGQRLMHEEPNCKIR